MGMLDKNYWQAAGFSILGRSRSSRAGLWFAATFAHDVNKTKKAVDHLYVIIGT